MKKKIEKEKKNHWNSKNTLKQLSTSTTIKNRPYNKKLRHELFFQHYFFKLLRNVFLSIFSLNLSHCINNRESHWTVTTHVYCMVTVDSIFLKLHASVSHELSLSATTMECTRWLISGVEGEPIFFLNFKQFLKNGNFIFTEFGKYIISTRVLFRAFGLYVQSCREKTCRRMGQSGRYGNMIISLFYQKIINTSKTSALPLEANI